jgi:hypothetical protein
MFRRRGPGGPFNGSWGSLFDEIVPYGDETRNALIMAVRSRVDPTCKRVVVRFSINPNFRLDMFGPLCLAATLLCG